MKKEDKEILKKAREKEALMNTPSFIAEYPNALNDGLCNKLIQYADTCLSMNPSLNRSTPQENTETYRRKDWFFFVHNFTIRFFQFFIIMTRGPTPFKIWT